MSEAGGDWYTGTANAVYQNLNFLDQYNPSYVLILSGDHIYKMDYRKMLKAHIANGADATIAAVTLLPAIIFIIVPPANSPTTLNSIPTHAPRVAKSTSFLTLPAARPTANVTMNSMNGKIYASEAI